MSGEESWSKYQGTVEETREYHDRYLKAVNNPIRRTILSILSEEEKSVEELSKITGLTKEALTWHLKILEWGFCVGAATKGNETVYRLKKEGEIIHFLEEYKREKHL